MEYRINRKTSDKISVVGLGTSYISEASEKDAYHTASNRMDMLVKMNIIKNEKE